MTEIYNSSWQIYKFHKFKKHLKFYDKKNKSFNYSSLNIRFNKIILHFQIPLFLYMWWFILRTKASKMFYKITAFVKSIQHDYISRHILTFILEKIDMNAWWSMYAYFVSRREINTRWDRNSLCDSGPKLNPHETHVS